MNVRALAFLFAIGATSPIHAQTPVLDDGFTDGGYTAGSDAADADWVAASGVTLAVVDDTTGLASGPALQYLGTGSFSRATVALPQTVTLAASGDRLVATLRLRMTRVSAANDGGIRFGLHNANGNPVTDDSTWSTASAAWDGYYFRGGVGDAPGMRIYRDVPGRGDAAMGGSGDDTVGSGTAWALNDTSAHTVRIEIARRSDGQSDLRFYVDGDLKQESQTTTIGGALATFTHLTIGSGSPELDLLIDDVTVTQDTVTLPSETPIDLSQRLVDWTRAGVQGGMPTTYANTIDFVAVGGDRWGHADNAPILQNLLNGLTEDTVIMFPAGTYRFDSPINIVRTTSRNPPRIILRGAGTAETQFDFHVSSASGSGLIRVSGYEESPDLTITGGLTRGSTGITVGTVGGVEAGDWILIRQDNDYDAMATTRDIPDYLETINNQNGWAARSVGQIAQVTAVNGGALTLDRPLHLDFTWANPTVTVLAPVRGVGLEGFTLNNREAAANRMNIQLQHVVNCWVRDVHSFMAMRFHVGVQFSANVTVRDSYFNDAYRHDGGGHGYGVLVTDTSTHVLVANNVFRNLRHSMIWKEGANGSVFAYNYSRDGNQDGSTIATDISGHGDYAFANLIEGNIAQRVHVSDYWGPIGPHNTFLRNRVTLGGFDIADGTVDQNILGNELVSPTSPFVTTDATSTGAFIHGNSQGGVVQWRETNTATVVDSYYYDATPDYWNIADPWPSMGPEYAAGTYTIPAQHRWETGAMNLFGSAVADGRLVNLSTRAQVGADADVLIAGFVIGGEGPRSLLLRGIGPGLGAFLDPATVVADATLTLFGADGELATNDDWSTAPQAATIATRAAELGAFALESGSGDAALLATLDPGSYTVHLAGKAGGGLGLIELYDAGGDDTGRLVNISTRGRVGNGLAVMVPGIVVRESSARLLIRGIGPELVESFGFAASDVLADPVLTLRDSNGELVATNDDWSDQSNASEIATVADEVGAFALTSGGADAGMLVTVPAGVYTAQVEDTAGGEGIAIVEVYAVP
ncbi:right-handed parallel beta-helix repeat-containing protein [Synoicihabitans lomoniglobus]|uniref:Right-handed parallel beta-helix repeat-containing protein n=1 Tax=Synoicihabitans lomoniglobus TaxID=2909285 RepID=A0AAE9ZT08_9BACT|nr:right-handed parallel beta-helix repeat-containing protein [Opitutaceae bacterium LMO-M01]WED63721.1 right-handed parallel beta-helix repeat-containing protein [Opitutaceae bacterium LMO-M01]